MPQPRRIDLLPEPVRAELEQKLIQNGFSDYYALSDWLDGQGYEIGKSAIHSYGQGLKRSLAAVKASTHAAKILVEAMDDPENRLSEALMGEVQSKLFEMSLKMREAEDLPLEQYVKLTGHIARAAADVARASISQKKHAASVVAKIDALLHEAQGGKSRLDVDTLQRIRKEVYGLA